MVHCVGRGAERTAIDDQLTSPAQPLHRDDAAQRSLSVASQLSGDQQNHVRAASAPSRLVGQRQERVGNETAGAGRWRRSLHEETQELGSFCLRFISVVIRTRRFFLKPRLHDTTCCQQPGKCLYTRYNRLSNPLSNRLYNPV